jgi:5-methylcytosine-specific restriction protein A
MKRVEELNMDATQMRKEFAGKVKRQYFKENAKMCGRCGDYRGIHLHHKVALCDGGTNEYDNLIPLCSLCHHDWHRALEGNISFDEFLQLPNVYEMATIMKQDPVILLDGGETVRLKEIIKLVRQTFRPYQKIEYQDKIKK